MGYFICEGKETMEERRIAFTLRVIHNQIKHIICKEAPHFEKGPKTQLQGGILAYLYHHLDQPIYQRDLEKEFCISRATATNTLQVMEREGLIMRRALDRDARLKRIQLTEEARQHHKRVESHMDMLERRLENGMSEEEIAQLRRLLGILLKNLEELSEESGEIFKEDCMEQNNRKEV